MSIVAPIVNIIKLQCGVDIVRSSPDVLEPVYAGMALSPVEICDPTNLRTALNVLLSVLALGRFRQLYVYHHPVVVWGGCNGTDWTIGSR